MTVGSLFAGIGGFDLGFERAGFELKWQVEISSFCRAVLRRHWPNVRRYGDVRRVGADNLERVDVVCAGFPCQDISFAGTGAGLSGARSGLWSEVYRLTGILRPRYLVVENVAALLQRGLERVLSDLSRIGYDAEWSPVSACAMGATHMRPRLLLVAYPDGEYGRPRFRHPASPAIRTLQTFDGFASARVGALARLAHPSELYRGANGLPSRLVAARNRAIGNSIDPLVSEWIARQIAEAEGITA